MPFIPHTQADTEAMLKAIGADGIEALFEEIPAGLRLEALKGAAGTSNGAPGPATGAVEPATGAADAATGAADAATGAPGAVMESSGPLTGIPEALTESGIGRLMRRRAARDEVALNFLGAGAYEHHIPAAVWELATRGEFYSAYTPYQAEASQGTLQVIYEYQTMIASLTGLDVSNASQYDGASALAEAVLMAVRCNRKSRSRRVLAPRALHPHYRAVVRTITSAQGIELVDLPWDPLGGHTDLAALEEFAGEDITAVLIPQPNVFGVLEPVDALTDWAAGNGAIAIGVVNPLSLGLLKPPGEWGAAGAAIACGEGQPLGVPLSSGGPYFGFLTCRQALVRQLPGRLVGRTVDLDGRPGFTLTLQAREQHIRRSRATSNICTNQGLMVTAATIYMSLLGPVGLRARRRHLPRPHGGARGGRANHRRRVGGVRVAPLPRGGVAAAGAGGRRAPAAREARHPGRREPPGLVPGTGGTRCWFAPRRPRSKRTSKPMSRRCASLSKSRRAGEGLIAGDRRTENRTVGHRRGRRVDGGCRWATRVRAAKFQ